MKKLIPLIVIILTMAAIAVMAAPPAPPRGPAGSQRGPEGPAEILPPELMAQFLGLTESQQTQARALGDALRATVTPLRDEARANHDAIEAALAAGNSARAGELMLANYKLHEQIESAHDTFRTSFEALLTAEQKAKFAVYNEIVELRRGEPRE